MKKRPNGCGNISKIKGRNKPYRVLGPAHYSVDHVNENGNIITKRAFIGYFSTYSEAVIALAEFSKNPYRISDESTFCDLFQRFIYKKEKSGKSKKTITSYRAAYKRCGRIKTMEIRRIGVRDLEEVFENNADASKSTVNNIKIVIDGVFELAERYGYITRNCAKLITADDMYYSEPAVPKHTAFSREDIKIVMTAKRDIIIDVTVILLYTGFRINELLKLTTSDMNIKEMYLQGGNKTIAGKNRIVPIHTKIQKLMTEYYSNAADGKMFDIKDVDYRKGLLALIDHQPHDTRHTFASRLQALGVDNVTIDRLIGHKSDSTRDRVYVHKDLDDLREAIEKLDYDDIARSMDSNL